MRKFEEFLKKKTIIKKSSDIFRSRDLILESDRKYANLKEILEKIGLKSDNSNDIIEQCYDILIYLIRAKLYSEGYVAKGNSSHEAEISYLKILGFSDKEIEFMDELRFFRNRIKYDGKKLDENYAKKVLDFVSKASKKLKKHLE